MHFSIIVWQYLLRWRYVYTFRTPWYIWKDSDYYICFIINIWLK